MRRGARGPSVLGIDQPKGCKSPTPGSIAINCLAEAAS